MRIVDLTCFLALAAAGANAIVSGKGSWKVKPGKTGSLCIHSLLLPNSKLVCVERPHQIPYPTLNPETGGWTSTMMDLTEPELKPVILKDLKTNAFCAGHAQAADGSVWVIGGDRQNSTDNADFNLLPGIDGRRKLVPPGDGENAAKWVNEDQLGIMDGGARWYPTVVTMYDGVIVIFSGTTTNIDFDDLGKNKNPTYEYWPAKKSGNLQKLDLLEWAYPHVLYPISFQLPSKKVFLMVSNRTIFIDREESGDVINEVDPLVADGKHEPWIYPNTPNGFLLPMYEETGYKATVMVCGGVQRDAFASPQCYSMNTDEPNPKWKQEPDMPRGRVMPDSVILPDGTILLTNGARWGVAGGNAGQAMYCAGPWFDTDLFDPQTRTWTASIGRTEVPRLYHSGAILLEDATVITTGSEMQNYADVWGTDEGNVKKFDTPLKPECHPNKKADGSMGDPCTSPYEMRIEVFTPPYLSANLPRPVIKSAPQTASYNSTIAIALDPAVKITSISLLRYTTTTHSTNTDQRFLGPKVLFNNGTHAIFRIPPHGGIAPPGNYHLFVVSSDGVPSIGKRVLIGDGDVTNVEVPNSPGITVSATPTGNSKPSSAGKFGSSVIVVGAVAVLAGVLAC
ncbi:hypothetical protein HDU97_007992 [Phlyctochytrium planicorne]|nr:hypothetical protein HDU97_007992 [Phlyctochytrium planicorne]